jgi:hypothetical protein
MDAIFARTRGALAKAVIPGSSFQFPAEPLNDARLRNRCCFCAHLPDPQMYTPSDATGDIVQGTRSCDCLQDVSALIQANHNTLWLLMSQHHDAIRTWLGLKIPPDVSLVQAKFYADQQGFRSKNSHRVAMLVRRRGSNDQVWLIDDTKLLRTHGTRQIEPRQAAACVIHNSSHWSNNICESVRLKSLQSDDIRVIKLARARSKSIFVSGCRGIACVLAEPSYLTIYDLEDIDSDNEGDDD